MLEVPGQDSNSIHLSCSHQIRQIIKRLQILHFHEGNKSKTFPTGQKNREYLDLQVSECIRQLSGYQKAAVRQLSDSHQVVV